MHVRYVNVQGQSFQRLLCMIYEARRTYLRISSDQEEKKAFSSFSEGYKKSNDSYRTTRLTIIL